MALSLSSVYVHLPFWSTVGIDPTAVVDGPGVLVVDVDIGLGQLAGGGQRAVFLDVAGGRALMVGTSLVPLMVIVTVPVVPSAVVTVKVSVSFSPAPRP